MNVEQVRDNRENSQRKPDDLVPRDKIGGDQTGGGPKTGLGQDID